MEHLVQADSEIARGRFRAALEHLAKMRPRQRSRHYLPHNLSTAEALQCIGYGKRAQRLATAGLRAVDRTRVTDARCMAVLARAAFDNGQVKRSARLFQRARAEAERARDGELTARILLDILASVVDWLPADDADGLVTQCEQAAAGSGRPHLAAQFHIVVAEMRVREGQLDQAAAHLRTAETFLRTSPNIWLDSRLHLVRAALHAWERDAVAGALAARKALACARQAGHAGTAASANAQLAHILLMEGRFRQAARRCRLGLSQDSEPFPVRLRLLGILAQVELAERRLPACDEQLSRLQDALPRNAGLYRSRHDIAVLVTRARLQLQRREWQACLTTCENGAAIADNRGDRLQGAVLHVLAADALIEIERLQDAAGRLDQAEPRAGRLPVGIRTQIDRARAAVLARTAGPEAARRRFEIALRVLAAAGDAAARMDAAASFLHTMRPANRGLHDEIARRPASLEPLIADSLPGSGARQAPRRQAANDHWPVPLAYATPLIGLGERPELLAREIFVLLRESGCAEALAIIEQQNTQVIRVPAHEGWTADQAARAARRRKGAVVLPAGDASGRDLAVVVAPRTDARSQAVVHDIQAVVDGARTLESIRTRERERPLRRLPDLPPAREDGVFASTTMLRLLERARLIAASDEPVLLVGETGTGKEVVARFIHKHSPRARKEFIAFNCAEVPAGMAESVLFGHRSGAYTGATENYDGVIRGAPSGTLLLDEIIDLQPSVQPKLLRFLDRGDVHPLGAQKPVHVDVRIIAATNPSIDQRIRDGAFRDDLYFRLNILRLDIPPLRERREEIPVLVHHFLQRLGAARGMPHLTVTDEVMDELYRHDWPGNVRQLENHVRRLTALATDDVLTSSALTAAETSGAPFGSALPASGGGASAAAEPDHLRVRTDQPLAEAVEEVERKLISRALAAAGGNAAAAARALGLSRARLKAQRQRLGIGEIQVPKA